MKGAWRKKPYQHVELKDSNDVSLRVVRRVGALTESRRAIQEKYLTVSASGNRHWAMPRKIRRQIERDMAKRIAKSGGAA
jgi:hypothetical protein